MAIQTCVQKITPEMATMMLQHNKSNRPVKPSHVEYLANQMMGKKWRVAQPISFADNGTLIDGQHRLEAIVRSGESVDMLVVRGLPASTYGVFDQGRTRTASDHYAQMGGQNSSQACATANTMMLGPKTQSRQHDRQALAQYTFEHRNTIDHVIKTLCKLKYVTGAERGAFATAMELYGEELVVPHMERLGSNLFTGPNDPMNTLNQWMIEKHTRTTNRKTTTPRELAYSAAVLAIKACVEGRTLSVLRPNGQDFV